MKPICLHCSDASRPVNRPRGLCWTCYYTPGVKNMYPSTSKFAMRGHGLGVTKGTMPHKPTKAAPGTPEKLAVIEERAANGQNLWHPDDATQ